MTPISWSFLPKKWNSILVPNPLRVGISQIHLFQVACEAKGCCISGDAWPRCGQWNEKKVGLAVVSRENFYTSKEGLKQEYFLLFPRMSFLDCDSLNVKSQWTPSQPEEDRPLREKDGSSGLRPWIDWPPRVPYSGLLYETWDKKFPCVELQAFLSWNFWNLQPKASWLGLWI